MQAIQQMESMGYTFTINNESIKYQFTGNNKPDISRITVLMAELKKDKQSAIRYLQGAGQNEYTRPIIQSKKVDDTLLAKNIISGIEEQALLLGWKLSQLAELEKTLPCFIPCQIGLMTPRSICIEIFHSDGSIRGAVTYYNNEVDQPWLKHIKK